MRSSLSESLQKVRLNSVKREKVKCTASSAGCGRPGFTVGGHKSLVRYRQQKWLGLGIDNRGKC